MNIALLESIADISYIAGNNGYYSGDSRKDINDFITAAEEFERLTHAVDWDDSSRDYMIEIQEYANKLFPKETEEEINIEINE